MTKKERELKDGLCAYKALVFGLINLATIIALWNDPNYRWLEIISLLAWVVYMFLSFFAGGAVQAEKETEAYQQYLLEQMERKKSNGNNEEEVDLYKKGNEDDQEKED